MKPEVLVSHIQKSPQTPEHLHHLLGFLSKHETMVQQHSQSLLEVLRPKHDSLGYLFVLWSWCHGFLNPNGDSVFVEKTSKFLAQCDEQQIVLAPGKFCMVCRTFKNQVVALKTPTKGIVPLCRAVEKLMCGRDSLTPVHVDFVLLCLTTKHYAAVGDLLERDIYDVDPKMTALTQTDFLLYCYYGARVCIGLKRYSRALDLLYMAIVAPAMVPNAIVAMAYKHFVLLSLMTSGSVPDLPKYTSTSIQRVLKGSECEAYSALAEAYSLHDRRVLEDCFEKHISAYEADNTVGLVKQVLASLVKRNILRLTQTYITLSLADIAASVHLPNAQSVEMYVLKMIEAKEIHAEINEMDGMVKFLEDPEDYNNAQMADYLDLQMSRCTELDRKLHEVHEDLMCDPDYLTKLATKETRLDDLGGRG